MSATAPRPAPLPDASQYIRLLEVNTDYNNGETRICCNLTEWPIEDAPIYQAVSYTWGLETPTEPIWMNGKVCMVRKNCADVLRSLAHFGTTSYFWIDALCIDQADKQAKSSQVARMGDIYEQAEGVVVCIGELDDDVGYAMRIMREVEEQLPRFHGLQPHQPHQHARCHAYVQVMSRELGPDFERFVRSLAALTRRPYFQRVWVVQELLLGRALHICCGSDLLPRSLVYGHLEEVAYAVSELCRDNDDYRYPQGVADFLRSQKGTVDKKAMELLYDVACLGRDGGRLKQLWKPSSLVHLTSSRQCEDPRDVLYSILALVSWGWKTPILPDYNKSVFNIAVEFLEVFSDGISRPRMAAELAIRLGIDINDPQVSDDSTTRRNSLLQQRQNVKVSFAMPTFGRIMFPFLGRQIMPEYSEISDVAEEGKQLYRTVRFRPPEGKESLCFAASVVEAGDWILMDRTSPERGSIVVRKAGACFAILGRAWNTDVRYFEPFNVFFSPDDFVVYAAAAGAAKGRSSDRDTLTDSMLDLLGVCICKKPFSSFALQRKPQSTAPKRFAQEQASLPSLRS